MPNISFKTLEVWNIEPAGNIKSIELIARFNVEARSLLTYFMYDSQNHRFQTYSARNYPKGDAVYPKFFETEIPDGIVRMEAYLVDANNHRISNIATKTLYLKKAQPASGIGQRALEDPTFNLPEFPEATVEASSIAQNPELISAKVERERLEVYVSSEEARAEIGTGFKRGQAYQSVREIEEAYEFFPEASAEVQQQLGSMGLSQETQNIIDDWAIKKIIIPSWFINNNMQWVLEGKISEQEFLAGYQNLVNTGIITYSQELEPEPDEPTPEEPTQTWWVIKPSGIIEQVTVTQKFIDKMTARGWIFSKERPTPPPENEDISVIFFVGTGGDLKTHFKFSSLIVAKDVQRELAKWISKNYGTTILTTFNNYTDNPVTHNLEEIKNLIKQKIQDDEPDEPEPEPEEILPNANMVRQEIGRFQVVNKTLKGKITYIATDSFDKHFYYNFETNSGEILKCYVIATDNEGNVLLSKQNDLRFSETERDETITISDYVDTEENKITVEFYVTNTPTQDSFEDDFAFVRTITTPYFPKKPDTLFGALFGLIAIPTALTLLGRKT